MSSFRDCRRFVSELEEQAVARLRNGDLPTHAVECSRCRGLLDAAVLQVRWLTKGLPVETPESLRSEEFAESVYDRVLESRADRGGLDRLHDILQSGIRPLTAPEDPDVAAALAGDSGAASSGQIRRWLASADSPGERGGRGAAPGWLWGRVLAELREHLAARRGRRGSRRRWAEVGMLAAVLLFGLWLGIPRGTSSGPEIVIVELQQPPLLEFMPVGLMGGGGGR